MWQLALVAINAFDILHPISNLLSRSFKMRLEWQPTLHVVRYQVCLQNLADELTSALYSFCTF